MNRSYKLELLRLIYGDPMTVLSSCLRSVIIASEGKELFCADYAAIEARVLFWIADHEWGLKAFREDRPIYEEMASQIYRRTITSQDKTERQVGKQVILGCGYGMGHKKFLETCSNYGIKIDESVARIAVETYRKAHAPIPALWSAIERTAIIAVEIPGKVRKINHTHWWKEDDFLWCSLPSGRNLAYYKPEIRYEDTPWGARRAKLYHWGMNSLTHKWELSSTYGGRLVENIVQATARDLMAEAMLRIEDAGYEVVLTVHDETLSEKRTGEGSLEEYISLMVELPSWATGLPIKAEGWVGKRYRK